MPLPALLPDFDSLELQQVDLSSDRLILRIQAISPTSACPRCQRPSSRVHSRYSRTLADLPSQGQPVRIELATRRFFCTEPDCPQKIFTERFNELAVAYGRTTRRLHEIHHLIGRELGGQAGARLAAPLGAPTSPDTLLRRVRSAPLPETTAVRVLGVDDWAWKKGHRYGTILCDLERHCPIDLLPERSADSFAAWLKDHPEVQIISRDRGDEYIKGATQGAPDAVQVADRFHLLVNGREALVRALERHHVKLKETTAALVAAKQAGSAPPAGPKRIPAQPPRRAPRPQVVLLSQQRRERRLSRYQQVIDLHQQGISMRQIARRLGIDRSTVRRYVSHGSFRERGARRVVTRLDRYLEYLKRRWTEGCQNAVQLTEELRAQGYRGSYYTVRRRLAGWPRNPLAASDPEPGFKCPSSRRVSWWLLKDGADLEPEQQAFVDDLLNRSAVLKQATELAREFTNMVRNRDESRWESWLMRVRDPSTDSELKSFAEGLARDETAIRAALVLPWSNGQVEGQINRLKLMKRQAYGRAGFELLRRRFLRAG